MRITQAPKSSDDRTTSLWLIAAIVFILLAIIIFRPLVPDIANSALTDLARESGRPDLVTDVLLWVTLFQPESAQMQEALGYSLYLQGEITGAIRAFEKAITIDEGSAAAQNNLGVALTNPVQALEAIEHLLIAIELDPSSADYYFNLGNAYLTYGDQSRAAEAYQHAFDLDPGQLDARALWAGIALRTWKFGPGRISLGESYKYHARPRFGEQRFRRYCGIRRPLYSGVALPRDGGGARSTRRENQILSGIGAGGAR